MANFPTNPSIGDLFETKHDTFKWNGSGWEALGRILTHRNKSGTPYSSLSIKESGGVLDEDDTSTILLVGEATEIGQVKAAHTSDANTKLLTGTTGVSGLSANTADLATSLLMNSNYDTSSSTHRIGRAADAKLIKGYYFDGSEDYVDIAASSDFDFGTSGDFTIEMWVYFNSFGNHNMLANQWSQSSGHTGDWQMFFRNSNSGQLEFFYRSSGSWAASAKTATAVALSTWTHLAIVRSSGTIKFYFNGVPDSTTVTDSGQIGDASKALRIGRTLQPDHNLNGYVDDFRVSNTARYTAGFTTEITTKDSNHKLILDGLATDSSDSSHSLTFNGNTHEVSKLGETSWKFDGTGDYLAPPNSNDWVFGTSDFTIEAWIYTTNNISGGGQPMIASNWDWGATKRSWAVQFGGGGKLRGYISNNGTSNTEGVNPNCYYLEGNTVTENTWQHIAFVRSGTGLYLFQNGALTNSTTIPSNFDLYNADECRIGSDNGGYGSDYQGYIGNLRISKGVGRYTSTFTPHTVPHTTDLTTKLLLQGGYDPSKILIAGFTSNTKMIPAGYSFDGDDYITVADHADFDLSSSSFTIEMWIKLESSVIDGGNHHIFNKSQSSNGYEVYVSGNKFTFECGSGAWLPSVQSDSAVSADIWYHLALTYDGATYKMYVDGTQQADTTSSGTYPAYNSSNVLTIGALRNSSGYGTACIISDLRLTKGAVRYTANFTSEITTKDSYHKLILDGAITDSSDSAHSVTFAGNANTLTKTAGYSMSFDGNAGYVNIPYEATLLPGTGAFTAECWIKTTRTTRSRFLSHYGASGTNKGWYLDVYNNAVRFFGGDGSSYILADGSTTINDGDWHHIALVLTGSNYNVYVDGVSEANGSYSININPESDLDFRIGNAHNMGWNQHFDGYVNDVHLSKTARYTSNFYITDATVMSDKSSSSHTLTAVGNAAISTTQKKFGTHALYFGGTNSDYMTIPQAAGTFAGDFTVECWVYMESGGSNYSDFLSKQGASGQTGWTIGRGYTNNKKLFFNVAGSTWDPIISDELELNRWYHVAGVRDSGTNKFFIDGTLIGTNTHSYTEVNTTVSIGNDGGTGGWGRAFKGYLDDIRFSDTARYTSTFNIDDVTTLADKKGTHTLTLNGDALIASSGSSGKTKFGTAAMEFDGTGDYISTSSVTLDGDFTIEVWVKPTTTNACKLMTIGDVKQANSFEIFRGGGTPSLRIDTGTGSGNSLLIQGSADVTVNEWQHIAAVRSGSTLTFYKDGASIGSTTTSATFTGDLRIGAEWWNGALSGTMTGYMDEFRISTSARYTAAFTPQSVEHDLIDVAGWGSPILESGQRALFVNSNGLVMKSSDGTLTKMDAGSNATVAGKLLLPAGTIPASNSKPTLYVTAGEDSNTKLLFIGNSLTCGMGKTIATAEQISVDTSVKHFGDSSLNFSQGNTDYFKLDDHEDFHIGTSDFTVETWIRGKSGNSDGINPILFMYDGTTDNRFQLYTASGKFLFFYNESGTTQIGMRTPDSSYADENWYHLVLTRVSGTWKIYLNGVDQTLTFWAGDATSASNIQNFPATKGPYIGYSWSGSSYYAHCNMQNYRFSKTARYTENFTPSTESFDADGGLYYRDPSGVKTKIS